MKTKLLSVLCTLLLPLTSTGAINPSSLTISNNPLSSTVATELLGKAYLHHQSLLNNSEVKIIIHCYQFICFLWHLPFLSLLHLILLFVALFLHLEPEPFAEPLVVAKRQFLQVS